MVKLMGLLCESKRVERKKITYDFPVFTLKLHLKFLKCANSVKTDTPRPESCDVIKKYAGKCNLFLVFIIQLV